MSSSSSSKGVTFFSYINPNFFNNLIELSLSGVVMAIILTNLNTFFASLIISMDAS